ncbi:MAG TPA: tetratricopeptide repeat protein [Streptosporangiaceae bacterium]
MAGNRMLPGEVQTERAGRPVLSGRIPPPADSCLLRQETGVTLDGMPPGGATVLAGPGRAAPEAAHDLGGTGKTQLAALLAREHLDSDAAHLVVWITAASEDAVIAGYAQALHDVGATAPSGPAEGPEGPEGVESAAAAFLEWLANTALPWLVVLDDLGDPAVAERWWPRGPAGQVLITTRHPDLVDPGAAHVARVGEFSPREALWYLAERLRADHDQRTGATDLAIELGFLPIALAQAAAVMTETGWTCRQYLELAIDRRAQLAAAQASAGQRATGHADTGQAGEGLAGEGRARPISPAAVTCSLSAQLASQLAPPGLAGRALSLISMLGPFGIPRVLLTSQAACAYLGGPDGYPVTAAQAWAAVQNLARAGLVAIDDGSAARSVLAHALVLSMARQSSTASAREQAVRAAADALADVWSSLAVPADVAQALRDCAVKLQDVGRAALWVPQCHPILIAAGQSLVSSGMAGQAVAYWRAMLRVSERHFGATHTQSAQFRDLLGTACELSGRPGEAVVMYTDLLTQLEQAGDGCQPEVLATRASLARAQAAAGRPADAVRLARQTLDRCEQVQGASHPDTLQAQAHLADSYLAAGQFKQAIDLCKRTVADRERAQGASHPETMAARTSLATAYRSGGKLKDAIKQYERALADRERVQDTADADTIAARRELAYTCCVAGKYAYSVAQYERALADCHEVLGSGHAITLATQEDLDAVAGYGLAKMGIDLRKRKPG